MFSRAKLFVAIDQGHYYSTPNLHYMLNFSFCCCELPYLVWGHPFITSIKIDQFFDSTHPTPASPKMNNRSILKNNRIRKNVNNSKNLSPTFHYNKVQDYRSGGTPNLCSTKNRKAFPIVLAKRSWPSKKGNIVKKENYFFFLEWAGFMRACQAN